jgi:hypothetical protein
MDEQKKGCCGAGVPCEEPVAITVVRLCYRDGGMVPISTDSGERLTQTATGDTMLVPCEEPLPAGDTVQV